MPTRKRGIDDWDPNKSDSNDSTFDVSTTRARPNKVPSKKIKRPRKKRRTGGYGDDSDISGDETDGSDDLSINDSSAVSEPEVDERTGRPVRRNKAKKVYAESDSNSDEFLEKLQDSDDEDEDEVKTAKRKPKETQPRRSLLVKLRDPNARRNTRRGSQAQRPTTSDGLDRPPTRRNTRSNIEAEDALVALSESGKHAEVTRPGTRSPDNTAPRAVRGGKGLKKPPSMVEEAEHESSNQTKTEPDEEEDQPVLEPEVSKEDDAEEAEEEVSKEPTVENDDDEVDDDGDGEDDVEMQDATVVPESNDEDDDDVVTRTRPRRKPSAINTTQVEAANEREQLTTGRSLRSSARDRSKRGSQRRKGIDDTSDFEPVPDEGGDEDISSSGEESPRKGSDDHDDSGSNTRRSRRGRTRASSRRIPSVERESEVADELAEELAELKSGRTRRRNRELADLSQDDRPQTRKRKPVDYRILKPDLNLAVEDDAAASANTPSRRARGAGGGWSRPLFSTYGPFGGAGGPAPIMGGPGGIGAVGGVDSDSSDDEGVGRGRGPNVGGMVGMTPTSAAPAGFGGFPTAAAQATSGEALQASLGKVKDKQALADADPLGVDPTVNFDAVGGLQGHIDQLKEMVALPLLYPEVFQRFKVTPPRGVLFHGPPGTGKTLMARALASSVSSGGRKVTFYMRKGADALSKWVGEAERQLRLLFEEARKNQPSIIFFDEIDGLAPVRSAKQDQIHSSIVSTLLALMDGMDGRGQVIVVGATNRPDSVDPALRRPGRFDREFYFPLPGTEARRKILDIHTKNWDPPPPDALKDELAEVTKGYGGADLRALCTEAALNAVQRRYPQIYSSNEKLQIDPATIKIAAKDFMVSVKKIVPSSERSASSGSSPLPKSIEPLLSSELKKIEKILAEILPPKKGLTALEEARFADAESEGSMRTERMQQEFERCRVFRPRLLLRGPGGMGQQYLSAALLNHFEGLHVQSFDLPTLLSDSTRSSEAAVVQFFTEVKRHKPSVIYIPNVDVWYQTVGEAVVSTFKTLLRSLSPTDPILVLGVLEDNDPDPHMIKDIFGYSKRNQFEIEKPSREGRQGYFQPILEYLSASPDSFPDPSDRKPRVLEKLAIVPPPPPEKPKPLTKEQKKAQKKKDRQTLNMLKIRIQPIMDQIKLKYRLFRNGVIDDKNIRYLYEEADPNIVTSDLEVTRAQFRPFEKDVDKKGEPCLKEQASGKFYYNMNTVLMEERLVNGYYKRPKDFLGDVKKLTKDARALEDLHRLNKASELQANVEVDMADFDHQMPGFQVECEALYQREKEHEKEVYEAARKAAEARGRPVAPFVSAMPPAQQDDVTQAGATVPILAPPTVNGAGQPATPRKEADQSHATNGTSDLSNLQGNRTESNGNSVPSKQGDVVMTNSDDSPSMRGTVDSSFGPSAQTRPLHFHTGAPSDLQQRHDAGALSQRSAITPMAEGSNPGMYHNSASTTSSDKRNTGSTDLYNNNTNSTTAANHAPTPIDSINNSRMDPPKTSTRGGADMSMLVGGEPSNSQLPSTQELQQYSQPTTIPSSSQSLSQVSAPAFPRDILNSNNTTSTSSPVVPVLPTPSLIVDARRNQAFFEHLVTSTSAFSVEQLEQVYSALMNEIWRARGEWNRSAVVEELAGLLEEVVEDMRGCQSFGPGSAEMGYLPGETLGDGMAYLPGETLGDGMRDFPKTQGKGMR